ncbi:MAG: hypothetical protein R6V11_11065 [Ectothiorhodospiraceae bacterium]
MFFAVWTLEKFIKPEAAINIAAAFYGLELNTAMAYATGAIQLVFLVLFAIGAWRTWSYGFFLVIHMVSVLSSYQQLLTPYDGYNHLFHASIPALGALVVLFLLRDSDSLLVLRTRKFMGD